MRLIDRFTLRGMRLLFGTRELCNLGQPFYAEVLEKRRRRRFSDLLVDPVSTFNVESGRMSRLVVPLSDATGFITYTSGEGVTCAHSIYDTARTSSPRFRLKTLLRLKSSIDQGVSSDVKQVVSYLKQIISVVCQGFDYDCVLTDVPARLFEDVNLTQRMLPDDAYLTGDTLCKKNAVKINILRQSYEVPLKQLSPKLLSKLPFEQSGLNESTAVRRIIDEYANTDKTCLILVWDHPSYAGYLRSYLSQHNVRACAISLFQIIRRKR